MKKWLFFVCLMAVSQAMQAAIYKHTDFHGRVTYSNRPLKGAVRITTDPEEKRREALEKARQAKAETQQKRSLPQIAAQNVSQAKLPPIAPVGRGEIPLIVDTNKQRMRDTQRERILSTELQGEMALREESQKNLESERAMRPSHSSKIKRLEEDLRVHDNNIAALQKEMNRMK